MLTNTTIWKNFSAQRQIHRPPLSTAQWKKIRPDLFFINEMILILTKQTEHACISSALKTHTEIIKTDAAEFKVIGPDFNF